MTTCQVNWDESAVQLSLPAACVTLEDGPNGVTCRIEFPLEEAATLHGELGRGINEALRLSLQRLQAK